MWILGLFEVADWLLLLTTLICATHLYLTWSPLYWQRRGVAGPPHYPIIGSVRFLSAAEKAKCSVEDYGRKNYGKVFGYTMADAHFLVVFDKEMLRQILVKDFNNFSDPTIFDFMKDEISEKFVSTLGGDDWRRVRAIITPTFSTGKLKLMMSTVWEIVRILDQNIGNVCDNDEDIEVKSLFGGFVMDTLARNAFGIEIDSQEGKDLIRHAKKAFKVDIDDYKTPAFMIWFFVPWLMPFLSRFMNTKMTDQTSMRYFAKIVEEIYASRGEEDKGRKDLMQLMMNAHEEEIDVETVNQETKELGGQFDHAKIKVRKGLSKQEIVAQGCAMFAGGHDTLAGTLSFLAYNLACYPDCQERLYEELVDLFGEAGNPDYSSLNKSPYLNMCIEETLRLYPILIMIQRRCSGNTTVGGIRVEKGDIISIPVLSIHRDPKIYPDPEKFDPERFTEEAKAARSPFHYLPFGYGPRHCVGMRLALMVMKAAMINLLRKYRFITCEKTEIPIDLQPAVLLKAKNGIWLKTERRSQAGSC